MSNLRDLVNLLDPTFWRVNSDTHIAFARTYDEAMKLAFAMPDTNRLGVFITPEQCGFPVGGVREFSKIMPLHEMFQLMAERAAEWELKYARKNSGNAETIHKRRSSTYSELESLRVKLRGVRADYARLRKLQGGQS